MLFFDLKSMSIVGRSDISFYLCKLVCRHFVTFTVFLYKCVFAYVIHIVDLSYIIM